MVAPFLRLRLSVLGNTLRRPARPLFLVLLRGVLVAALAVALAAVPVLLAGDNPGYLADIDALTVSVILALTFLVPFFTNRGVLSPRYFGPFPASSGSVAAGLALGTLISWPALTLLLWGLSHFAFRADWRAAPWAAVLALALILLLAVLFTRIGATLSELIFTTPRARGLRSVVGSVLLLSALPLAFFLFSPGRGKPTEQTSADVADLLEWTPLGAPIRAIADAAAGDSQTALLRLGIALGLVVVLFLLWALLCRRALSTVETPVAPGLARTGLGWFERFSARPSGLIGARMVTYWIRDPRYRVALLAIPFAPVAMIAALAVAGMGFASLALIPLPVICFLLAWSIHNDVASDSTAIWSHVASGTRGRDDRLGRVTPVLMLGVPVVLIGSSITVAIIGEWRLLPAVIGMSLGVLLVGAGVSSISSVLGPYPTTRPGDSPFVQPQWSGSGSGLAQTLSVSAAIVLSVPAVVVSVTAITDLTLPAQLWALGFGLGYGLVILALGIAIGGKIFERRGPEILALSQIFD